MYYIVNEPPRWLKVVVRLAILGVAAGILLSMIIFFGVSLSGIVGLLLVTAIIFGMTFINRRRNKRG